MELPRDFRASWPIGGFMGRSHLQKPRCVSNGERNSTKHGWAGKNVIEPATRLGKGSPAPPLPTTTKMVRHSVFPARYRVPLRQLVQRNHVLRARTRPSRSRRPRARARAPAKIIGMGAPLQRAMRGILPAQRVRSRSLATVQIHMGMTCLSMRQAMDPHPGIFRQIQAGKNSRLGRRYFPASRRRCWNE